MAAKKAIGAKLDDQLRAQVLSKCQSKGCTTSDYLKELVTKDIAASAQPNPEPSESSMKRVGADLEREPQKQEPQQQVKIVLPSIMPAYRCIGENCGRLHPNPNYKGPPKGRCGSCDQFSSFASGSCPWCKYGHLEPLHEEDLTYYDLRVPAQDR